MNNMIVSVNPHIYAKDTTQTIMRDVLIALFPAVIEIGRASCRERVYTPV